MKVPKNTDCRVVRTQATLRDALVALIGSRAWDDISVQDICDRANVGRSTFYVHFADKEDLLISGFADLKAGLQAHVAAAADGSAGLAFARGLFAHAFDNQRIFRALVGKRSGEVVNKLFRQLVVEMTHEELARRLTPAMLDATTHYVAGAFVGVLTAWLDAKKPASLDEVEAQFQMMTSAVLRAAGRADAKASAS